MTRIYLIRHGTTDNNKNGIFQGTIDSELGRQGIEQAECLGERLRDVRLDAIYTSPLKRARQTAEAIGKYHNLIPIEDKRLMEINGGELEGYSSERNTRLYPEQMYYLDARPSLFQAPGGESSRELYDRMVEGIGSIAKRHSGGNLAVISHGFAIQLYLGYAQKVPFDKIERYIVGNASISLITYDEDFNVKAESINDETHIPKELRFYVAPGFMSDIQEACVQES